MDKAEAINWLTAHGFHKVHPRVYRRVDVSVYTKTDASGRYSSGDARYPFVSGYGVSPEDSICDLAKQIRKHAESDSLDVLTMIA